MEEDSFPYRAEYAKSGRAACKGCKNNIAKDSLRLAVMVQSPFFDGKQPNWHHFDCFFRRCRPKDSSEIAHYQSLRWEDQEKITKKISSTNGELVELPKKGKGKKRNVEINIPNLLDYTLEYAKSGKSKCRLCEEYIKKNDVRISKKDFDSERALQYGPLERWHHIDCFLKVRDELQFFGSGSVLPGFKSLSPEDKAMVKEKIPEIKQEDNTDGPSPTKKSKESVPDSVKEEMKKQNEVVFKFHDELKDYHKSDLILLLEHNKQAVPEGVSKILDRLSDVMAFGALKPCEKCKGQLVFRSGVGYACTGHISEWSRCENKTSKPGRVPFRIPKELKKKYDFLNKFKGKIGERLFVETSVNGSGDDKETVKIEKTEFVRPLEGVEFLLHKIGDGDASELKNKIKEVGGKVVGKFSDIIAAVISTADEVKKSKLAKAIKSAKDAGIPVLPPDAFTDLTPSTSRDEVIKLFRERSISSWESEIEKRILPEKAIVPKKSNYPAKSEMFKSGESVKKITLKDGLVVDPDSELDKVAHVYRSGKDIYSTVLSLTDVQSNRNSYYKLQILESDKKNKYWLFRAWGRIGTTIGGNKVDSHSLSNCIEIFKELFEEKSGNSWDMRSEFQKVPGKMMMLDISYKEEKKNEVVKPKVESAVSTLHKAIQDLITLIFDIEEMRKTMLEFELDLVKMPLGKISQSQIQKAFAILTELQNFIQSNEEKHLITDRTNRFYTLIPHDHGVSSPPLLNNEKLIQQKIEVLNNLMDIEIAYKLLQECEESGNTIDDHYKKLNTKITVIDPDSEEFKIIEVYVKNTHAKTHMNYSLEIEQIFKVERKGESQRYKKFSKFHNRKLLWHGSRITNFAGILSQGLRIAPPEAPVTGYMFGKGIYFADMVSKSANYCMTSKQNPTGLLLLCEVALGDMYELTEAKNITKLPSGKHSVKGLGKTVPDPEEFARTPAGAEVPLGTGIEADVKDSSLLYNEYIVYDVSQVKIQYLLRLKFNHLV